MNKLQKKWKYAIIIIIISSHFITLYGIKEFKKMTTDTPTPSFPSVKTLV